MGVLNRPQELKSCIDYMYYAALMVIDIYGLCIH